MRDRRGTNAPAISASVSPPKPFGSRPKGSGPRSIASMRTRFSSATDERKSVSGVVGREVHQRGHTERLAGIADQRLFDRGIVLRPQNHGTVQIGGKLTGASLAWMFVSNPETRRRHIGIEDLVADPVQRIEPSVSFLGIVLALSPAPCSLQFLLGKQVVADALQILLELFAFFLAGIGAEHARREAVEAARHRQGVRIGQAGRLSSLRSSSMAAPPSKRTLSPCSGCFRYGRPRRSARSCRLPAYRCRD